MCALMFVYFIIVLLCGLIFGICVLISNSVVYANLQSNNSILDKNNTASNLSKTANSSNRSTTADLSPDLGYHYEYNFY